MLVKTALCLIVLCMAVTVFGQSPKKNAKRIRKLQKQIGLLEKEDKKHKSEIDALKNDLKDLKDAVATTPTPTTPAPTTPSPTTPSPTTPSPTTPAPTTPSPTTPAPTTPAPTTKAAVSCKMYDVDPVRLRLAVSCNSDVKIRKNELYDEDGQSFEDCKSDCISDPSCEMVVAKYQDGGHTCVQFSSVCTSQDDSSGVDRIDKVAIKHCIRCYGDGFLCTDGSRCIGGDRKCDGNDDCDDSSDELPCRIGCNSGFRRLREGGICYKLFTEPKTWPLAQMECGLYGAKLAQPKNATENSDVLEIALWNYGAMDVSWIWLGGNDVITEEKWMYGAQEITGWSNWEPGFPASGREANYMCMVTRNGVWNPCMNRLTTKYVCQQTCD